MYAKQAIDSEQHYLELLGNIPYDSILFRDSFKWLKDYEQEQFETEELRSIIKHPLKIIDNNTVRAKLRSSINHLFKIIKNNNTTVNKDGDKFDLEQHFRNHILPTERAILSRELKAYNYLDAISYFTNQKLSARPPKLLMPLMLVTCLLFWNMLSIISLIASILFFAIALISTTPKEFILDRLAVVWDTLSLPRLAIAVISSWLLITVSDEIWNLTFFNNFNYKLSLLLLIPSLISVFSNITLSELSNKTRLSRAITVLYIGFVWSVSVGLIVINFSGEHMLSRNSSLDDYFTSIVERQIDFEQKTKTNNLPIISTPEYFMVALKLLGEDKIKALDPELLEKCLSDSSLFFIRNNHSKALPLFISSLDGTLNGYYSPTYNLPATMGSFDSVCNELTNITYPDNAYNINQSTDNLFQLLEYTDINGKPVLTRLWKINMLPRELLIRSCLALFIAIVLQLIFDNKKITEPLN